MAIAFDAATSGAFSTGLTHTFGHTVGGGSDRALVVGVAGDGITGANDISGATYDGVSMGPVASLGVAGMDRFLYVFVLPAPNSGTHDVIVSAATGHDIFASAISYTGVDQASPIHVFDDNTIPAGADELTTSLTTAIDACWGLVLAGGYAGNDAPIAGAGSTRRAWDTAFGTYGMFDSDGELTPAGVHAMTTGYPSPALSAIGHIMLALKPAGAPGGGNSRANRRGLMGIF